MGRLKVSFYVHPVVLQRDLTHLDNCYGEDDDDNGGDGDDVEDGVGFPPMDFNLLNHLSRHLSAKGGGQSKSSAAIAICRAHTKSAAL